MHNTNLTNHSESTKLHICEHREQHNSTNPLDKRKSRPNTKLHICEHREQHKSINEVIANSHITLVRNGNKLQEQINQLTVEQLKSTISRRGRVKVSELAKILNCHRNTLLNNIGTKDQITELVINILDGNESSSYPNKTTAKPKPASKPKPRSYTSTSQSEIYATEIQEHIEKYEKEYKSVLATGDMDKVEQVIKKYETLNLPNGYQYWIK